MALKILEDSAKSFKVQRSDGQVIHIAKTPETEPIYRLCKGGAVGYAQGGLVQEAEQLAPLAMMFLNKGGDVAGKVPGKAQVKGDSPKNDTVDAKLSPGELVIPREVVAKGPEAIAAWVKDALAGKHPAKKGGDGKVHAFDGAGPTNVYQQTADAEIPQTPPPQQFQGTPSVASEPAPPLTTADTGMTSPTTGTTPTTTPQPIVTLAQNTPPPGVNQGPTVAEAGVPGNGATPEKPVPQGSGSLNRSSPYGLITSNQATESSTSRPELAKAAGDFDKAVADNQKATVDALTAQQQQVAARATAEANTADEYNKQMAAVNADRNKEINSRLLQIKDVTNKYLGMSVDSNHLYGDSGTGSRIMAGIGLMMGAFGQGLSGKDSPVPGIIERNIDRDIGVQKANIEKAGQNVEMLRGGLKEYMGATDDMQTAMAAEKARQLDMVGKRFEAIAAANSSPIIKAQAMQQSMAFREKAAQLHGEVVQNTTSKTVQQQMPHLEAQNAEQVNKVQANIAVQSKTDHLKEMVNSGVFKPGPIAGRVALLKNKFGLSDEAAQDFLQNSSQITDQIVHDIAGARGLNPTEFKNLQNLGANITNEPEPFLKALDNINRQAAGENAVIAQTNAENHRFPMDLQAKRQDYDKANPAFFASKVAFTPQGGHKPKRGK